MTDKRASADWYKPMTRAQLREVVAHYGSHLPGWKLVGGRTTLPRETFPVQQSIWFQPMGSGSYRPTHVVSALPCPECSVGMLGRVTRHPVTVEYRWHATNWETMLAGMERDFRPNIREPLDIAEVLEACKDSSQREPYDLVMFAILTAWLGRDAEAIDYCRQIQAYSNPQGLSESEQAIVAFGPALRVAITLGEAQAFLKESAGKL